MNKPEQTQNNSADKDTRTKRTYSKEVMARARKIQAARKAEDNKKAAEERKVRMAKRVEDKKKVEVAKKKVTAEKQKAVSAEREKSVTSVVEPIFITPKLTTPTDTDELVDFAVTARKYKTYLTRKFKERKFWVEPSPFEILSYIPGTVISVDVKVGKIVEEGKQLLILEAMKMQNKVEMPFTARIKKINVKAGEKIPKDFVMIELEAVEK